MYLFDPVMRMLHKSKNDFLKTRTSLAILINISRADKKSGISKLPKSCRSTLYMYRERIWTLLLCLSRTKLNIHYAGFIRAAMHLPVSIIILYLFAELDY